jgi:hypothetical protein
MDGRHGDKPESPTTRTRTWPKGPTPLWSRPLLLLLRALLSFQNIATAAAARGEGRWRLDHETGRIRRAGGGEGYSGEEATKH